MYRPEFDAKLKVALALAAQLEKVLIAWGKAMEAEQKKGSRKT